MTPEYVIIYDLNGGREVRLFAHALEDAMVTAQFLSANSDIRCSSLYRATAAEHTEVPAHTFLCQFQHGTMHRLHPQGEQLLGGDLNKKFMMPQFSHK